MYTSTNRTCDCNINVKLFLNLHNGKLFVSLPVSGVSFLEQNNNSKKSEQFFSYAVGYFQSDIYIFIYSSALWLFKLTILTVPLRNCWHLFDTIIFFLNAICKEKLPSSLSLRSKYFSSFLKYYYFILLFYRLHKLNSEF